MDAIGKMKACSNTIEVKRFLGGMCLLPNLDSSFRSHIRGSLQTIEKEEQVSLGT